MALLDSGAARWAPAPERAFPNRLDGAAAAAAVPVNSTAWAGAALRLQLLTPAGSVPPAWLDAALAGLVQQLPNPGGWRLVRVLDVHRDGMPQLVLHVGSLPLGSALDADAVHWAVCERGDGEQDGVDKTASGADHTAATLCLQQPVRAARVAGRGIALCCLQHNPASGQWHERGTLRVAASTRPGAGHAALTAAVQRLLALSLTRWALHAPLSAAPVRVGPTPAPAGWLHTAWQLLAGHTRAVAARWRAVALGESWRIGVIDQPLVQLLQPGPLPPVRWLTEASADGYWADPFGMPGDPSRLACEHVAHASGIGRLECLTLGADGQPPQRRVLAVGGGRHASFPAQCSLDGQRLGVAETLHARSCVLHAVSPAGDWSPLWPLLQGVAAADPALFQWQGRYWLAYTDTALGAQDNLCLHHAATLRGPWLPHAANPVKVDVASARMAGNLFVHDGVLYRPGQDCQRGYGSAVVLHRVDRLTPTDFAETAVRRVAPDASGPCPDGLHTLNGWGAQTLVDGKRLTLLSAAGLWRKLRRRGVHSAGHAGQPDPAGQAALAEDGAAPPGSVFVYVPHLRTGGGELSMLELAAGLADAGRPVWLVVHTARTQELLLPPGVQLVSLGREGTAGALWRLAQLVQRQRPQWLVSAFPHSNVAAVAAVALARWMTFGRWRAQGRVATRCVVSEHAPVSLQMAQHANWRYRVLPPLLRWAYARADAVVAVSDGVRDDLLALLGTRRVQTQGNACHRIAPVVIRNPVLPPTFDAELAAPPSHPWLLDLQLQVVLSVGRLADEKDLPTLLHAFATLHRQQPHTRLLLAGDGPERQRLEALVATLGLQAVVQLPGRTRQPLRWMRHAAVLVLASRFEGFGNVLVEALACNTPVVATDCPVGPREILQGGRFGALVPVGDSAAMAAAIQQALLQATPPPGARDAALQHTRQRAAAAYLALFDRLTATDQAAAC